MNLNEIPMKEMPDDYPPGRPVFFKKSVPGRHMSLVDLSQVTPLTMNCISIRDFEAIGFGCSEFRKRV